MTDHNDDDMVSQAISFLNNESAKNLSLNDKIDFLQKKGLDSQKIIDAVKLLHASNSSVPLKAAKSWLHGNLLPLVASIGMGLAVYYFTGDLDEDDESQITSDITSSENVSVPQLVNNETNSNDKVVKAVKNDPSDDPEWVKKILSAYESLADDVKHLKEENIELKKLTSTMMTNGSLSTTNMGESKPIMMTSQDYIIRMKEVVLRIHHYFLSRSSSSTITSAGMTSSSSVSTSTDMNGFIQASKILIMYYKTVIENPNVPRYRRIAIQNSNFKNALECLLHVKMQPYPLLVTTSHMDTLLHKNTNKDSDKNTKEIQKVEWSLCDEIMASVGFVRHGNYYEWLWCDPTLSNTNNTFTTPPPSTAPDSPNHNPLDPPEVTTPTSISNVTSATSTNTPMYRFGSSYSHKSKQTPDPTIIPPIYSTTSGNNNLIEKYRDYVPIPDNDIADMVLRECISLLSELKQKEENILRGYTNGYTNGYPSHPSSTHGYSTHPSLSHTTGYSSPYGSYSMHQPPLSNPHNIHASLSNTTPPTTTMTNNNNNNSISSMMTSPYPVVGIPGSYPMPPPPHHHHHHIYPNNNNMPPSNTHTTYTSYNNVSSNGIHQSGNNIYQVPPHMSNNTTANTMLPASHMQSTFTQPTTMTAPSQLTSSSSNQSQRYSMYESHMIPSNMSNIHVNVPGAAHSIENISATNNTSISSSHIQHIDNNIVIHTDSKSDCNSVGTSAQLDHASLVTNVIPINPDTNTTTTITTMLPLSNTISAQPTNTINVTNTTIGGNNSNTNNGINISTTESSTTSLSAAATTTPTTTPTTTAVLPTAPISFAEIMKRAKMSQKTTQPKSDNIVTIATSTTTTSSDNTTSTTDNNTASTTTDSTNVTNNNILENVLSEKVTELNTNNNMIKNEDTGIFVSNKHVKAVIRDNENNIKH